MMFNHHGREFYPCDHPAIRAAYYFIAFGLVTLTRRCRAFSMTAETVTTGSDRVF